METAFRANILSLRRDTPRVHLCAIISLFPEFLMATLMSVKSDTLKRHLRVLVLRSDRRTVALTVGGLCLAGALAVGVYVALLGPFFALAGGLALMISIPMLRSVRWGLTVLMSIATLLPFATLPFKIGLTLTLLDLALLVVFLVWIMEIAVGRRQSLQGSSIGILVATFSILAIFAFMAGLSHAHPTPTTARRFVEILLGIALFFVTVDSVRRRHDLTWLIRAFMFVGFVAAAIAIALYIMPETASLRALNVLGRFGYPTGNVLRYVEDNPDNPMRAIGTSVDPNVLGGLLLLMAAMTAPQLLTVCPLFPRWFVSVMLATETLALYLTYSRVTGVFSSF
jgi:hypothetical protein